MKYTFKVENKSIEVEINSGATFHAETGLVINHVDYNLSVAGIKNNKVSSFMLDNKFYEVELEKNGDGYPTGIYVNGDYYSASLVKIDRTTYYREKPLELSKPGLVKSFIPGSIKKIFFELNDMVNEGQIVVIHEAMKMENEIRAPRTGRLKFLGVSEGDNILANHPLFEIE